MPTNRPRHVITESDEVAQALDDAARRWPADHSSRSRLVLRLLEEGHRVVAGQRRLEAAARRERVVRTSGVLTGVYRTGHLEELRKDWPV